MLFNSNELIDQQEGIEIFNNVGRQDTLEGRLTIKLMINPVPQINWEFESATSNDHLQDPFSDASIRLTSREETDPCLVVENSQITNLKNRMGLPPRNSGNALQVMYGDINAPAHRFEFYIANACFMSKSQLGSLTKTITERDGRIRQRCPDGRAFQAILGDWMIDLETSQAALDWLEPKYRNRGSMITTSGFLCQVQIDFSKSYELPSNIQAKSLLQVCDLLIHLGWLISFANAGHLGPLYIKAERYTGNRESIIEPVAVAALAYTTSPIEALGTSWVTYSSDLKSFIGCFPAFQRMIMNIAWQEKWMLLLEWYFQATPSRLSSRSKTWFTISNALGTLLEHLAHLILVVDETDPTKKQANEKLFKNTGHSQKRLKRLLARIGVVEEEAWVEDFITVRNDATHAIIKNTVTPSRRNEVIRRATQWIDEVLLWRLGYSGDYLDRVNDYSVQSRYDLSKRNPDW
jgi:hypothetical protein